VRAGGDDGVGDAITFYKQVTSDKNRHQGSKPSVSTPHFRGALGAKEQYARTHMDNPRFRVDAPNMPAAAPTYIARAWPAPAPLQPSCSKARNPAFSSLMHQPRTVLLIVKFV
jgi:hypothetical protein